MTTRLLVGTKGGRVGIGGRYGGGRGQETGKRPFIFLLLKLCTLFYHFITDINHDLTKSQFIYQN